MVLAQHLGKYLAALTAAGVGVFAQTSEASIVASGFVNITIPSTISGVFLNVVTGQFGTSLGTAPSGWDVNLWSSSELDMFTPTPNPGGGSYFGTGSFYDNLPIGGTVGPAGTYSGTGTATLNPATPFILNSDSNFVGFRFINELTGNQVHYGYMRIAVSGSAGSQPRSIVSYAYEDQPGVAISFFPSPGAASLLAIGGFTAMRRRR